MQDANRPKAQEESQRLLDDARQDQVRGIRRMKVFREGRDYIRTVLLYALTITVLIFMLSKPLSTFQLFSGICFIGMSLYIGRPIQESQIFIYDDHIIGIDSTSRTHRYEFSNLDLTMDLEYIVIKSEKNAFFIGLWWRDFDEIHSILNELSESNRARPQT